MGEGLLRHLVPEKHNAAYADGSLETYHFTFD